MLPMLTIHSLQCSRQKPKAKAIVSMTFVKVHFLPDNVATSAKAGESWLAVAARAGVHISTGCLAGACHACEITIVKGSSGQDAAQGTAPEAVEEEPVLACLQSVPQGAEHIEVNLLSDPTW